MSIRVNISNVFSDLQKTLNLSPVKKQVASVRKNYDTSVTTLYKPQGSTSHGFKQLASTATDVQTNVKSSVPNQVVDQVGIAQLDVSASEKDLKKILSGSDRTDLETITGKSELVTDGVLDVVITAPFPEAIATTLKNTTTLNSGTVTGVVQSNVEVANSSDEDVEDPSTNSIKSIVGNVFPDDNSSSVQRSTAVSTLTVNSIDLSNRSDEGFPSLVENTVEQSSHPTRTLLSGVTTSSISNADLKRIIELQNNGKTKAAADILSRYSDKTIPELEATISQINNKASVQINEAVAPRNLSVKRTDNFPNVWREATTDVTNANVFSPVIGTEITAEVLNLRRDVTEIVIQFLGRPGATIQDYHNLYSQKYSIGFNPHFYIGYDAITYRGRPLEIEASSLPTTITNNHYQRSIIISVNINDESYSHKFAPNQRDRLLSLIDHILTAKPGMQVYSSKDVGWNCSAYEDALDVQLFVKQKLGKVNIPNYDPRNQDPLTSTALANFYVGT